MIDEEFKVYLIEANINPCLAVTSSFSSKFITLLVDNTLRMAIDPLFQPPGEFGTKRSPILPEIKYELIFDQKTEGKDIDKLYTNLDDNNKMLLGELDAASDNEDEMMEEDYPDEDY